MTVLVERLLLTLILVPIALILLPLNPSWWVIDICAAIVLYIYYRWRDHDAITSQESWALVGASLLVVGASLWIARSHGVSLGDVNGLKTLPKFVRRLPDFGFVLFTLGALGIVTADPSKARRKPPSEPTA